MGVAKTGILILLHCFAAMN